MFHHAAKPGVGAVLRKQARVGRELVAEGLGHGVAEGVEDLMGRPASEVVEAEGSPLLLVNRGAQADLLKPLSLGAA